MDPLAPGALDNPPTSQLRQGRRYSDFNSQLHPGGFSDLQGAFLQIQLLCADSEHGITLQSYDANFLHKLKLRVCPPPSTELTLGLAYAEGRAMIVSGTFLLSYCLIRTLTGLNIGKLQVIEQIKHSIQDIRTGIRGSELRTSFQVVLVMVKSIFSALIKICLIAPR